MAQYKSRVYIDAKLRSSATVTSASLYTPRMSDAELERIGARALRPKGEPVAIDNIATVGKFKTAAEIAALTSS